MLLSLLVMPLFARDVGAEQNCSAMVPELLNPYFIMRRISFQADHERCREREFHSSLTGIIEIRL